MAFRYSDLLVDVWASNGCPNPSAPQCPAPSKPQCPNPSQQPPGIRSVPASGGLTLLQEQLRHSVNG